MSQTEQTDRQTGQTTDR